MNSDPIKFVTPQYQSLLSLGQESGQPWVASARLLAHAALSALARGEEADVRVEAAKAAASRSAPEVLMLGHLVHGGNGVIEENDLYFFTLRGKERSLAWGSVDALLPTVLQQNVGDMDRGAAVGIWNLSRGFGPLGQLEIGALATIIGVAATQALNGLILSLIHI